MNKKILLISPSVNSTRKTPKELRIPEISLAYIASFTPQEFNVEILEEEVEAIDFDKDCDLVGISCVTANAPRGYEVAAEFKKRGKTVVMGGMHPTVCPDEALQYADSVVIGEAEGAWEILLKDYTSGKIKPTYRNLKPDVSNYPLPRRDLSKGKTMFNIKPVVTTRGCPYNCDFCCVPEFFGRKLRHLDIDKVVEDLATAGSKNFLFLDDNIIGHPKYSIELFKAIKHLHIKWVGQASISFVKNTELMKTAAESGCVSLFFGLESVSKHQLDKLRKNPKDIFEVEEAIKKVRDIGILFHTSMVFGFDDDTESVFDDTLEFVLKNKVGSGSFNILTPYPGTQIYKKFKEEGRLITEDWRYYDHNTVVYKPKNLTPRQLAEGHLNFKKEFFKFGSILKRFSGSLNHPLLYWAMNMGGRKAHKILESSFEDRLSDILSNYDEHPLELPIQEPIVATSV